MDYHAQNTALSGSFHRSSQGVAFVMTIKHQHHRRLLSLFLPYKQQLYVFHIQQETLLLLIKPYELLLSICLQLLSLLVPSAVVFFNLVSKGESLRNLVLFVSRVITLQVCFLSVCLFITF